MGDYAAPPSDNAPATKEEAEARAGAAVDFRGTYGGASGRAAQNWQIIQQNEEQRKQQQAATQTRREREQASQRNQQATGGTDYAVSSRENVRDRAGYTAPEDLGDTRTRMIERLLGFNPDNPPEAAQGVILESQRQAAYDTPTLKDDFFYAGELSKWKENKVELSSEYHYETKASGLQQKANPYEYAGDLALESLKGSPRKSSEYTSPESGSMREVLPGGRGLQEVMWDSAVARDRNQPQPERVSYMDSVRVLNAAEGLYGSYGKLYGGKVDTRSAFDVLGAQKVSEPAAVFSEANAQRPFLAVGVTHQEVLIPSEFDLWAMQMNIPVVSGAAVATSDFLLGGRTKMTIDTGQPVYGPEQIEYGTPTQSIRELPDGSTVITTTTPITSTRGVFTPVTTRTEALPSGFDYGQSRFAEQVTKKVAPELTLPRTGTTADYNIALVEGGYNELRNKPLTAAMNVGVGMLFVAGGEVFAGLGTGTVAATQGMRVLGPVARGANFLVNKVAPPVLAGMYVTDVAGRSTEWGADFSTESTKRLGGILTTETIPMIAGGVAFANRGAIVSGAKDVYGRVVENPPSFGGMREAVSDKVFGFRQRVSGVENLGRASGTTYYSETFETPWRAPSATDGITRRLNAVNPTFEETPSGLFSRATDLIPLKYERTVSGSAYDISRINANYNPAGDTIGISINRDIITSDRFGGAKVVTRSTQMDISAEQYALATGRDIIPQVPIATGRTDIFRTQTVKDVYASGRTYENVIGRKVSVEVPGTEVSGLISSRGITYGQSVIAQKAMANADVALDYGVTPRFSQSPLAASDLPSTITDLTSGFGSIRTPSNLPVAAQADFAIGVNRIVRARAPIEDVFGEYAIQTAPSEAELGVTLPGSAKGQQVSSLFKTLPDYGVSATETLSTYEGHPLAPVLETRNTFDVSGEMNELLYGKEANAFESASLRLRSTGTEKLLKTGELRFKGRITPPAPVTRKFVPDIEDAGNVGSGSSKLLITGKTSPAARAYTETVGKTVEEVLRKSEQAQQPSQELSSPTMEYLSPFARKRVFVGEEQEIWRANVPGMKRPSAQATEQGVSSLSEVSQAQNQRSMVMMSPVIKPANIQNKFSESSLKSETLSERMLKQNTRINQKNKPYQDFIPAVDITQEPFTDQTLKTGQITDKGFMQKQRLIQNPDIVITPEIEPTIIRRPDITTTAPPIETIFPVLPGIPGLPSSGGSGGGYSYEPRIVTWTFSNPVGAERLIADRGKKLKPMKTMKFGMKMPKY
jgi:hypothetical protein